MPTGYTPPTGSTVNLNFTGAYVPPAGNNVILNFFNTNAYLLAADAGSYAVAGAAAALKVGRRISAYEQLLPGMRADGFGVVDISGWTVSGLSGFALVNSGIVLTDASSGSGVAYAAIAVNPGQRYTLEGYLTTITAPIGISVGTTPGGQQLGAVLSFANGTVIVPTNPATIPLKRLSFTAPAGGVVYVSLYLGTSGQGRAGYLRMEQDGFYAFTGTDPTITKTGRILPADAGDYAMTGTAVSLRVGRRLVADPGVYTQSRTSVSLRWGHLLQPAAGSYTLTGSDPSLSYLQGRFIRPDEGSFTFTGSPARLLYGRRLQIAAGTYSFSGSDVAWVYRRLIKADAGSYALTGAALQLRIGHRLVAAPGSYVLSGSDVDLVNRRLTADAGTYAIAGTDARLLAGRRIAADPGVYTLSGANALLLYGHRLVATPGSYAMLAGDVGIKAGRLLTVAAGAYAIAGVGALLRRGYTVHAVPGSYALTWAAAGVLTTRRMLAAAGVYRTTWPDVELTPTWRPRGPRSIAVGFAASRYVAVEPQNRRVAVEPQDRRCSVEPAPRRYAAVEPRDKEVLGGSMLKWPEKDPNEVLDYELDWADPEEPRLETGETLLTSAWTVLEGDVVIDQVRTTFTPQGLSTVWVSGGTPGTKCVLLNRVTTSTVPRSYDKEVLLRVRDH